MKSLILTLALVLCFATVSFGEDKTTVFSSKIFENALNGILFETVSFQQDAERNDWQLRMSTAEARRSRGLRNTWVGLGGLVVGSVIVSSSGPDLRSLLAGNIGNSQRMIGSLIALGGVGWAGYGLYNWIGSGDELDNLDREGRLKGYLTLAPALSGTPQLAWKFEF